MDQLILGSRTLVASGLSVGYVMWLVRGGLLLSSVLSSLPAWRFIDPLPIFAYAMKPGDEESDDDESLESLVKKGPHARESKTDEADSND